MEINWQSLDNYLLFNKKLSSLWKDVLDLKRFPSLKKACVWLLTSGTTSFKKDSLRFVALSKEALLNSAQSVNETFDIKSNERWLCKLPLFHVAGLSILARAFLSQSEVYFSEKWDPFLFVKEARGFHLTSLVPQQVYDLVSFNLKAPRSLRMVFVGGGALNEHIRQKALQLNWPLYISYGLTELSSQIATARKPFSSQMKLLKHVKARLSQEGCLQLCSPSLFSAYIRVFSDKRIILEERKNDWFETKDIASLEEDVLFIKGRKDMKKKISGELIDLEKLEVVLEDILLSRKLPLFKSFLKLKRYDRKGYSIEMVCEKELQKKASLIFCEFNKKVMPFERVSRLEFVDSIEKSDLGKVLRC